MQLPAASYCHEADGSPGPGGGGRRRMRRPGTGAVIPAEFRAACGHLGAQVQVRKVPVTIAHAACDLAGVAISYRYRGGATVPRGGGTGIGNSSGFELTVHPGSLDVTITVTGPPGNA